MNQADEGPGYDSRAMLVHVGSAYHVHVLIRCSRFVQPVQESQRCKIYICAGQVTFMSIGRTWFQAESVYTTNVLIHLLLFSVLVLGWAVPGGVRVADVAAPHAGAGPEGPPVRDAAEGLPEEASPGPPGPQRRRK